MWCLNYHPEVQLLVKRFIFLLRSWRNHVEHKLQWTENLCTHSSACLWMHVQSTVVFDFCGYNMFYSMTLVLRCNSIHRYITYEALWTIDKIISVMSMVRHCLPSIFDVGICFLSIQHLHPPPSHTPPPGMQVSDPQAFQCLTSTDRSLCCYLSAERYFIQVSTYIKRKADLIILAVSQTRTLWFNDF